MGFQLRSVNLGQRLAAVGALLLLVFLFVGWYTVGGSLGEFASAFGVNVSISGWEAHTFLRWLMLLTIVVAFGLAFLSGTGRQTPRLPVSGSVLLAALAALTTILVALRVLVWQPGADELVDLKFGAWLGLASLVVIVLGGWLSMRAEGVSIRAAGAQLRKAVEPQPRESKHPGPPAEPHV